MRQFIMALWGILLWAAWFAIHSLLFDFTPPFWVHIGVAFLTTEYVKCVYDEYESLREQEEKEKNDQ